MPHYLDSVYFFFFNDTATTEIYTLSLHDALPISMDVFSYQVGNYLVGNENGAAGLEITYLGPELEFTEAAVIAITGAEIDRKSTRLNSSHANISYAVFCLKKKKNTTVHRTSLSSK